jgi:TolB protein
LDWAAFSIYARDHSERAMRVLGGLVMIACAFWSLAVASQPSMGASGGSLPQIAFASTRSGEGDLYDLHVMEADGSNVRVLTYAHRQGDSHDFAPAWSPDGRKIAFSSQHDCMMGRCVEIRVMNVDGSDLQRLTSPGLRSGQADWSPDGTRIAFARESTHEGFIDRGDIHVMNSDGSDQRRLTRTKVVECQPDWSPDGKLIVFARPCGGKAHIWVMNSDGSSPRQLTRSTAQDWAPRWSPDGTQIAFSRGTLRKDYEVMVMSSDGTNVHKLTDNEADDFTPVWSPDGQMIVFASAGYGFQHLFVMNADGSNERTLTSGEGDDMQPAWSPVSIGP